MPIITGGGGGGLGNVVLTGTPAAGKVPVATGAAAAAWAYPPGFEWSYTQRTTNVAVASGTEATGTTILSPGAFTPDGAAVLVTFYAPVVQYDSATVGDSVIVSLFESVTQITRLAVTKTQETAVANSLPAYGQFEFTPTAAAHTYTITAFATSQTGAPTVIAGAGGTAAFPPCFVRFAKV